MTTYNATSGHPISGITLSTGDFAYVSSGGSATSVTIDNDSGLYVLSGGVATFTILSGGFETLSSGGVASGGVVSAGTEVVNAGGTASFAVVSGNGAEDVYAGGSAISTTISGGIEGVYHGGTVTGSVVIADGGEFVYSGGTAIATVVKDGGSQSVYSDGVASGTVISIGGTVVVNQGSTIDFAVVSRGGAFELHDLPYVSGGSATLSGSDLLTITEGGNSATFQLAGTYDGEAFQATPDQEPYAGTVVTLVRTQRTMAWTGATNTDFASATNWNDLTNAENPAGWAPDALATTEFLGGGGTIAGSGTASVLEFGGTAPWNVTSGATLTAASFVAVGLGGDGPLLINGGASIDGTGTSDEISSDSGAGASVTVDGAGSIWRSAGELAIGDFGMGGLTISNDASVSAAATGSLPAMALAAASGDIGSLSVTGAGSRATLTGQLIVGEAGAGTLSISSQGTVQTGDDPGLDPTEGFDIAQMAGAAGQATVTGTRSLLTNIGRFVVGDAGAGSLSILAGATVTTAPGAGSSLPGAVIGSTASASGASVNVSGAGSNWQVTGLLDVGLFGTGALSIVEGATVTASALDAGIVASAVGDISVTDATLALSGNATVADDGTAVLSVLSGATFSAASLTIGSQGASSGAVVVSGKGSVINLAGALNVGTALGTGDLTIGPGATVNAKVVNLRGQVVLEGGDLDPTVTLINQGETVGGSGTIEAGGIVDEGVIQAGGNQPLVVSGTVLGGGPWTINGTAQIQANGGVGVLQINAGGTLQLTGPVLNAGSTTLTGDVTPRSTYTVTNSVVEVNFEDATGVLKLDDIAGFAGTIAAFQKGDSFVISGGTLSNPGVTNGNTLTMSDSGNGGTDKLLFAASVSAGGFSIVNGDTVQVACFAAGTRIVVENGYVRVEDLCVGDRVVTVDGRIQPIVWIGQRAVNCAAHPKPETVWPVRVSAGAFGENVPVRDLFLSPDHAVFLNNVLIPVNLLINGTSIAREERSKVTYYHVELERHEVIMAEGLTVESYLDLGDRANFGGAGAAIRLFPDFAARLAPDTAAAWETRGAAPLVLAGDALTAARHMIGGHEIRRRTG